MSNKATIPDKPISYYTAKPLVVPNLKGPVNEIQLTLLCETMTFFTWLPKK